MDDYKQIHSKMTFYDVSFNSEAIIQARMNNLTMVNLCQAIKLYLISLLMCLSNKSYSSLEFIRNNEIYDLPTECWAFRGIITNVGRVWMCFGLLWH